MNYISNHFEIIYIYYLDLINTTAVLLMILLLVWTLLSYYQFSTPKFWHNFETNCILLSMVIIIWKKDKEEAKQFPLFIRSLSPFNYIVFSPPYRFQSAIIKTIQNSKKVILLNNISFHSSFLLDNSNITIDTAIIIIITIDTAIIITINTALIIE